MDAPQEDLKINSRLDGGEDVDGVGGHVAEGQVGHVAVALRLGGRFIGRIEF